MIEPRGGKMAFTFSACAARYWDGGVVCKHGVGITAADSEDEAHREVMKDLLTRLSEEDGWNGHDVILKRVDEIEWVGRIVTAQGDLMQEGV